MAFEIFGYKITKNKREKEQPFIATPVTPSNNDGSTIVSVGNSGLMSGYYQYNFDVDGTVRSDAQMISQYRATASYPDVDTAIEAIVNEAVVVDQSNPPVSINLDNLPDDYSAIKDAIQDNFQHVLNVLEFNDNCHDIFKRWYIDGKLYYFVIIDPNDPKKGIIDLKYIDPRKIRKVIEYVKENRDGVDVIVDQRQYYVFNDNGLTNAQGGIKISTDSIINVRSGLIDANSGEVVSYLFKAIKPTNQLKMMEDSLVIYRITRAPERRVFYVDVGNLPGQKAEQYVRNIMNKFRNKTVYDAATGEVKQGRHYQSMVEDWFLPRREGGKATEIQTLPGCLAMDTKVSLLDGRELSIRQIADELNDGKTLWTYSCDPVSGKVVPGKIDWAGVTQKSAKVLKITLDNGESIICTPDHKFPIKNVGFVRADQLKINDSLIPLYRRQHKIDPAYENQYEQYYDNDTHKWYFTHRKVVEYTQDLKTFGNKRVIHHGDLNRFNNNPENLVQMDWQQHRALHNELGFRYKEKMIAEGREDEWKQWKRDIGHYTWDKRSDQEKADHLKAMENGCFEMFDKLKQEGKWDEYCAKFTHCGVKAQQTRKQQMKDPKWREQFKENCRKAQNDPRLIEARIARRCKIDEDIAKFIVDLCKQPVKRSSSAQRIVNILNSTDWVIERMNKLNTSGPYYWNGQFTAERLKSCVCNFYKLDGWTTFKENLPYLNHRIVAIELLEDPIEVGTLTIDGDEIYHDFHTFALSCGVFTKNSQNLSQIEDVQYFQGKLYQAMNVPRQRLMPDNLMSIGNNNEITREEVAFSKFIQRLRNRFNVLFKEALRIQLIATKTIRQSDWEAIRNNIFFEYQHDNYFEELKRIDIFNQRMTQLQTADGFKGVYFSKQYIARNVLDMSEELWNDIQQQIKQEQIDEAIAAADLERKTAEYQAQASGSDDDGQQQSSDDSDDSGYDSFVDGDEGSADEGDDVEQSGDTTDTIDDTAEPNPGEDNFERPAATGLTVAR